MVFLEENIAYTQSVVEDSWDLIHPDIARLLLEWNIKVKTRVITVGEERIYAKVETELGRLIPNTGSLKPVHRWGTIPAYNCKDLGIPGQRLNGKIPMIPRVREKWTGKMCKFWELVYPHVMAYTESSEPITDVQEQVEIVFPSGGPPSGRWKHMKFEEIAEKVRQENKLLVKKIIAGS
jgi:hypothetical protein